MQKQLEITEETKLHFARKNFKENRTLIWVPKKLSIHFKRTNKEEQKLLSVRLIL